MVPRATAKEKAAQVLSINDAVHEMYVDMYVGKDKENPSITLRIDRLEQLVIKISKNSDAIKYLLIAAIFAIIGDALSPHIHF